jgi:MFS family permease
MIIIIIIIIVAASAAAGGVTSMDDFLAKFFPSVLRKKQGVAGAIGRTKSPARAAYCEYNDQSLQLFTSSLYLAALVATFFASGCTQRDGRRATLLVAGLFFDAGAVLNASAQNLVMLIVGRIALGCGVGFANQVPLSCTT